MNSITLKEIGMRNFKEFIKEANELDIRNQIVDIEKIVTDKANIWNEKLSSDIGEDDIKRIVDYMNKSKNFSLAKMDARFGSAKVSNGFLKSVINAVKTAISESGVGRVGTQSKTQSRADRIDSFLKQKHIGPISKK